MLRPMPTTHRVPAVPPSGTAGTHPTAAPSGVGAHLPLLAALTTVVLWASAFVGIRTVADDLGAGPLALGRLAIASVLLGGLLAARREGLPPRSVLAGSVLCGLLWFAAYNVLLNQAERTVDAGTAAMLVNVGPVLIAGLAGVLLKEGFPRALLLGGAVALAGATTIGLATADADAGATGGALLALAAAAAYAGGVVAQKPLLARASALQVTWAACTVGAVACLPFLPALTRDLQDAGAGSIAWLLYLAAFPTALAFTTWAYALSRTTAGRMGATTYLVPPLAVLLGWAALGESPPALALAGGALCLTGVVLARR